MKKYLLTLLVFSLFTPITKAASSSNIDKSLSCKMPKGKRLTIGCTYKCGRWNKWAVRRFARKLGYKVRLVDLSAKNATIDHTQVDGIIIPGGVDINPKYYKDAVTPEYKAHIERYEHLTNLTKLGEKRDKFEFGVLSEYFSNPKQRNQPILGICRGMQALTVSQGIPLYQDIKAELGIKNRKYTLDRVSTANPESLIAELINRKRYRTVKLHHQGLSLPYFNKHKKKWPNLEVTSYSHKNRIAESLEFYDRPILGVQYHPEWTFGRVRRGIFRWLLQRSCINYHLKNKKN